MAVETYTVYVLENGEGKIYIGYTSDLPRRISEHNNPHGRKAWTRGKGPWVLVYTEQYTSKREAIIREQFLKTGVGRDFLQASISKL